MSSNPPGHPGIRPHWTSSAKDGAGAAITAKSRVWLAPARVRWSCDGWQTSTDAGARDTGPGIYLVDLPDNQPDAGVLEFTFYWPQTDRWEGRNFMVELSPRK